VANDNDIVPRGTAEGTTVADFFFDVGDDCAFGHDAEGENIADSQVCFFAGIDELASVHALVGDKCFGAVLVAVGIAEDNFGERGTTAGIVDDFLDDASKVAMSFSVLHTRTHTVRTWGIGNQGVWAGESLHQGLGIWQHPSADACGPGKCRQTFCERVSNEVDMRMWWYYLCARITRPIENRTARTCELGRACSWNEAIDQLRP
jgi:hypothetical protein